MLNLMTAKHRRSSSVAKAICFLHPQREAAARCVSCGRSFCRECVTPLDRRMYCAACFKEKTGAKEKHKRDWFLLSVASQFVLGLLGCGSPPTSSVACWWNCRPVSTREPCGGSLFPNCPTGIEMPKIRKPRDEHPLLHTMEEATTLLRRCPVQVWFWWFIGSAPFVCCLLHFWSDMSRAADARSRLAESALYLALAYGFMKVAHAVFGDHLLRLLRGDEDSAPLPLRGKLRLVSSQALIQCTTPWVLVLASAAVLPLGWAYAFYHNANVLALSVFREGGPHARSLPARLRAAPVPPRAKTTAVVTVLLLFSVLVWMNIAIGSIMVAMLMKSFTGVENGIYAQPVDLSRGPGFLAATMGVSYLVAGPFVKASYAVRCFYGLSRKNGEDIMVRFPPWPSGLPVHGHAGSGLLRGDV